MLKCLLLLVLLFCHRACHGDRRDFSDIGWQAWLLVEPESPRHVHEEGEAPKTRRITPKSVFIAPAFSGSSPLPDCAEGYRADAMGRCVKLVQLNHAAQLNFLLQKLNAMYANNPAEKDYEDQAPSDSSSGPLHVTIPLEMPPEPEEASKESVEVAVVMADVMKEDQADRKKPETETAQTIVAVWNVGKNGTQLEEVETTSNLNAQATNNSNSTSKATDATKYDIVSEDSNSTASKTHSSANPSGDSSMKTSDSAMGLLEKVGAVISNDGRLGNTSRRNVSSATHAKKQNTTENVYFSPSAVKKDSLHDFSETDMDGAAALEMQKASETNADVASQQSSYVRFPADDSDYSSNPYDRGSSPYDYVRFPQSWLPSDLRQRQTYWWLPPGWRLDPTRHQPVLIRFWARMPLLRDPMENMADNYRDANFVRRRRPLVY